MSRIMSPARAALMNRKSRLQQVFDLSEAGISLMDHNSDKRFQEPFLYSMFKWVEKIPTADIKTAGVAYYAPRNAYVFVYNPFFMAKLGWTSKDDPTPCEEGRLRQKAVILHELFHIHGRHLNERTLAELFRQKLEHDQFIHKAANHAMDLSINSTLELDLLLNCGLFPGGIENPTPEELEKNRYAGLPKKKSAEYYAHAFLQSEELLRPFKSSDDMLSRLEKDLEDILQGNKPAPAPPNPSTCEAPENPPNDPCPPSQGSGNGDACEHEEDENCAGEPPDQNCGGGSGGQSPSGGNCGGGSGQSQQQQQQDDDRLGAYDGFDKVPDVFDDTHLPNSPSKGEDFSEENLYNSMLRQALKDMKQRGWGTMPSHMQEAILDRVRIKPVNWKQELRRLVGRTERLSHHSTLQKINKRYPYQHPGKRSSHTAKILVAVDESGSVSNELLAKIFAALQQLSGNVAFYLCPFTSEIDAKDVKRIDRFTRIPEVRQLTGGTSFQAVTDFANQGAYEALIIATDMECSIPGPCRIPRWWLTNKEGAEYDARAKVSQGEILLVVE